MFTRRFASLGLVLSLLAVACGGAVETAAPVSDEPTSAEAPATPEAESPVAVQETPEMVAEEVTPVERPAANPDRQPAPDFSLLLSDGSTFVLSEEARPVMMVFWAEW